MLKKILFVGIVFVAGLLLFCLSQIQYDLSLKEDNTEAIEVVDYFG